LTTVKAAGLVFDLLGNLLADLHQALALIFRKIDVLTPVLKNTRVSLVIPNMIYTLAGTSARTNAASQAVSVQVAISSLVPPTSSILTAAEGALGVPSASIGISTNRPRFDPSPPDPRDRASQRHSEDGDTSCSPQNATALCPLFSYKPTKRFRPRGVNRRRDCRCGLFGWVWESIVVVMGAGTSCNYLPRHLSAVGLSAYPVPGEPLTAAPRLLNYIVAIYLIVILLLGLFGAGTFHLK
jgi:DUF3096 family protein